MNSLRDLLSAYNDSMIPKHRDTIFLEKENQAGMRERLPYSINSCR